MGSERCVGGSSGLERDESYRLVVCWRLVEGLGGFAIVRAGRGRGLDNGRSGGKRVCCSIVKNVEVVGERFVEVEGEKRRVDLVE